MVVPVETASTKHEVGARTLRPKYRVWDEYIVPLEARPVRRPADDLARERRRSLERPAYAALAIDRSVRPVRRFQGGTAPARARLAALPRRAPRRVRQEPPRAGGGRGLAHEPLSALRPDLAGGARARRPRRGPADDEDRAAYLEELVVRRELAMNHVFHDERYDTYEAVPDWARRTLDAGATTPAPTLHARAA